LKTENIKFSISENMQTHNVKRDHLFLTTDGENERWGTEMRNCWRWGGIKSNHY